MSFLHLHCHSDRTIGRSLIRPSQLVEYYSKVGIKGACITDNGNLSAAIQLYNACKKKELKPIVGMEVNVVFDKSLKDQKSNTIVLLARNIEGFYNLVKIATIGSMFFYYFPRVDIQTIAKYSKGLICLSSDVRGYVASRFFEKGQDGLDVVYDQFMTVFDGEFYWELQPTQTEAQRVYNEALLSFAQGVESIKLVATGDPHYIEKDDIELHRKLLKARNFRNEGWDYPFRGEFHVLSRDDIETLFTLLHGRDVCNTDEMKRALDQPLKILEKVEHYDLRQGTKVPGVK